MVISANRGQVQDAEAERKSERLTLVGWQWRWDQGRPHNKESLGLTVEG